MVIWAAEVLPCAEEGDEFDGKWVAFEHPREEIPEGKQRGIAYSRKEVAIARAVHMINVRIRIESMLLR
ncbi:MAG: hypothetical protein Q7S77_02490 [Candidatus Staskawiczbacteria bacterium]|nr:hypothetical protein [Candidatus Staskawiczbacteria bacterium]